MTVTIDASLVVGESVTQVDPADYDFFNLLAATTAGPQIAPQSAVPIVNPLTGETLQYLDGVVIGAQSGSLEGTVTATILSSFGLSATQNIDLSREAELVVFTYEQPDGSQLVVRATIQNGAGPTLQEVVNGYTLENLLTDADTVNGAAYTFTGGGTTPPVVNPFDGTDGDDLTTGTDAAEEILGLEGNDTLRTGAGDDTAIGGPGDDVLGGQAGNDSLDAGIGNDKIWAGIGNDTIIAGAGNDTMGGGAGDDSVDAGDGDDVAWAGAGNDTVDGGAGNDVVGGGAGDDVLTTGAGNNTAWGGTGADAITAENGADTIGGGAGNDTISAGGGFDVIYGGGDNDSIDAGAGNDTIGGGSGNDTVTGGAGADTFLFAAPTSGEADVVTDFEDGTDVIELGNISGADDAAKFATLSISDGASGAEISVQGHTITLNGVSASDLTVDDFSFL